jgi:VWFA-related protein
MRNVRARLLMMVLLVLSTAGIGVFRLCAQQVGSGIPNPAIRVNTRLVLLDVVVTDKQGRAVTGLKVEDFVVEENGKKQKVSSFVTPEDAAKATEAAPTLAPGLYTNRPEFRSSGGPLTILLLDAANTPFKDQSYSRFQMLAYVRSQMKPDQRLAVFTLTNDLHMLQDFTSDPQILLAALQKLKPEEPILVNAAAPPDSALGPGPGPGAASANLVSMAQNQISGFQSEQVGFALDRRVQITLAGMRVLARALGGLPGRKEVIWLTAAFPFELIPENRDVSDAELLASLPNIEQKSVGTLSAGAIAEQQREAYAPEIRQVAAELSASQVAIYPVDVRGLMSGMEGAAGTLPVHSQNVGAFDPTAGFQDIAASQDTMREVAAETGGRAYVNQNDIKSGVAAALADSSGTYTLGYYPENKKWDNKYRSIKVKLNRDRMQVHHRRGYYAVDPSRVKDRKSEQEVSEALRGTIPATLVIFSARAKTNDKGKLHVDFLVDPTSLSAADASGGGKKLNVTLYAAVFSGDGKMIANHSLKVDQELKPDVYQQVLQHGMLVPMDFDVLPPANSQLRLAVRDERTGFIGTTAGQLVTQ